MAREDIVHLHAAFTDEGFPFDGIKAALREELGFEATTSYGLPSPVDKRFQDGDLEVLARRMRPEDPFFADPEARIEVRSGFHQFNLRHTMRHTVLFTWWMSFERAVPPVGLDALLDCPALIGAWAATGESIRTQFGQSAWTSEQREGRAPIRELFMDYAPVRAGWRLWLGGSLRSVLEEHGAAERWAPFVRPAEHCLIVELYADPRTWAEPAHLDLQSELQYRLLDASDERDAPG